MPKACPAWGCTNRQKKRSGNAENRSQDVTFHRFPLSNPVLLHQWLIHLKRADFKPSPSTRICSEHFDKNDFDDYGFQRRLKKTAVPTLFSYPDRLKPKKNTPRRVIERKPPVLENSEKRKVRPKPTSNEILRAYIHDHAGYFKHECSHIKKTSSRLIVMKRKLKSAKQKLQRRDEKCKYLKNIISDLKNQNLIQSAAHELLEDAFGGLSLTLFKHKLKVRKTHKNGFRYDDPVKKFAITLQYLSPKAYDFVRPILSLPHPATLRLWRSSVNCQPGFLTEMLQATQQSVGTDNLCSLIVDEMSLRQEIVWCPETHSYSGFVDYGGGPLMDTVASNALVFLLVGLKGHWKTPVAFFFTDHVAGETLARDIKEAIMKAADFGLLVKTVVTDGLKSNMKAARELGCNLSVPIPDPSFNHPHSRFAGEKIYFICDPPHMLKLMRNLVAEKSNIKTSTGGLISWNFITALHNLQKRDSLYLANKLRGRHINYKNVKMKVNIAAQTLSSSVATAIDHLRDDLRLQEFAGSEATCQFIRFMDRLFDILNSKNPVAVGHKAPMGTWNQESWESFLESVPEYLLSLQDAMGRDLHKTPRGQAVLGFIVTAQSTLTLARDLLGSGRLKYLLTYKFSQDHLETYFSKVRQRGGWNNNPNSCQFRFALRSLMMQNSITSSTHANAVALDGTMDIHLPFSSITRSTQNSEDVDVNDEEFLDAVQKLDSTLILADTDWRRSCLLYTAGFVCRRLRKRIKCEECCEALVRAENMSSDPTFAFVDRKNNGGLMSASDGVLQIVFAAEKAFRLVMPSPAEMFSLPHTKFVDLRMQSLVLHYLQDKLHTLFPTLTDHILHHEIAVEDDHISQLVRLITAYYIRMRLHKASRLHHQRVILGGKSGKRMRLNKLILFSGE